MFSRSRSPELAVEYLDTPASPDTEEEYEDECVYEVESECELIYSDISSY